MAAFTMRRFYPVVAILLFAGVGTAGCSSTPPPKAAFAAAEVALREAREADAAEHATGPYVLAQDKFERANDALTAEKYTTARRLAEQAEVDAQLAEAQARSAIANMRAAELKESIRLLREEIKLRAPGTS